MAGPQTSTVEVGPWETGVTLSGDGRWDTWTMVALLAVTIFGAVIRARGLASAGLFRDDAWVALSSHVGLGTAWHMWVTAPGFGLVERTWMIVGPSRTWWYQLLPYVCSVAAVPAIFFLARSFRLGRWVALALAVVVCTSPICVEWSTAVKEFPFDFLLSCLLIALAEAARRRPERRPLVAFAAASAAAFVVSASLGVVVVALWAALVALTVRDRPALRRTLAAGAATAAVCGAVVVVFYARLSPNLTRYWNGYYIRHSSARAVASSLAHTAKNLVVPHLLGLPSSPSALGILVVVVWAGLSLVALFSDRAMLGPALAVVAAFVASAAQLAPLGTGRTDEYLYPPLLLLVAAGASRIPALASAAFPRTPITRVRTAVVAAIGLVSLLAAGVLIQHAERFTFTYPGVDVPALAAKLHLHEQPGDHVYVTLLTRYPWAFYEDFPPHVKFGPKWLTGFTVVSTDPRVFIEPDDYPTAAQRARWVNDMSAYPRVWLVETTPISRRREISKVFRRAGWLPVKTVYAPGCAATLFVRPSDSAVP